MGLRWHLPLPGPFSVSGRVIPRVRPPRLPRVDLSPTEQAGADIVRDWLDRRADRRDARADGRDYVAKLAELRVEEARLAERAAAAEYLAELEATAIVHERDGMPGSAAEYRRMAAEYREQRSDIAGLVVLPDDEPEPEPVAEPVRLRRDPDRPIRRSLFG